MGDAYSEGKFAWAAEVPRNECPYTEDPTQWRDRRDWLAGWDDMAADNSQFGVGA